MAVLGLAAIMSVSMFVCGCAKKEEPVKKAAPEKKEEVLKVIGRESEGEYVYKITLTNKTAKNIVGVSIKDSSLEAYPENMLSEGDVFSADEKRNLYYDAEAAMKAADDKLLTPQIDVQITFEDQTVCVLTAFPFDDLKAGEIHFEDEVAFLQYKSLASKENVSTKEAELAVKAAKEQAEAEAEAAAKAQAEAEAKAQAEAEAKAQAEAEAQRQREQQKAQPKPQPQPQPQETPGGAQDGCVNDGLVY